MTTLVLDVGSSSVRALLFDDAARLIPGALAQQAHSFRTAGSSSTADTRHLQALAEQCIDTILAHPAADRIMAVGMATFAGSLVGVDAAGQPLTPLYTYADAACAEDVALLRKQVDEAAVHQRTGCRLHTAYQPARLHWLRRTQPQVWQQAAQWLDMGTFLYRQWFGVSRCSNSAAAWSGLLNRAALAWDADWCDRLGLAQDALPALGDYTDAMQGLQSSYATRWRSLRDVPFFLAVGDGAAASIGSGAVQHGQMALTVGTTAALRQTLDTSPTPIPAGLWCYRVDRALALLGGATNEGGSIFQWARGMLALPPAETLDAELLRRTPDAHGLTVLPLLAGERSPGWQAEATGTLHGLRLSTTPLDMLQALLESVALRLALIAEQMGTANADGGIYAGGGALSASAAWAQIICDALNQPLHMVTEPEVTARGVALLVARALNQQAVGTLPPRIGRTLTPRPDASARLDAARQRQQALYHALYTGSAQTA